MQYRFVDDEFYLLCFFDLKSDRFIYVHLRL